MIIKGSQDRSLEMRAEAETIEECCLLNCSTLFPQPSFLYSPRPQVQGRYHPQFTGPSYISHLKKIPPQTYPLNNWGSFFSGVSSLHQVDIINHYTVPFWNLSSCMCILPEWNHTVPIVRDIFQHQFYRQTLI